jgi:aminodeoxyfutalosine synthase
MGNVCMTMTDTSIPGRVSAETALGLAREEPLHGLCTRAMLERRRRFGLSAFYVYNQHLNFTNICKNTCRFCAFRKSAGEEGSYTYTLEQAEKRIRERLAEPVTEVHIVGGLNPDLPPSYYYDLIRTVKRVRPEVKVKAYTAVEVGFLAHAQGRSTRSVLEELAEAGLDVLPGGGAEVFTPTLRRSLCPEKLSGKEWLRIHEEAHSLGIPSNATMLFGHVETLEDRVEHLLALRDLQDRTAGFKCFIPLPYQPGNNPLGAEGPDGLDILRTIALSRIVLDNIEHIKAYWAYMGLKTAQVGLWAGADDLDGTIVEEKIGHAAGAATPKGLTLSELCTAIVQAGMEPVERNALFEEIHQIRRRA